MEIITGIERRRQWRVEDKLRIVAEAERPGACFVEVARRHEVSRSVLWAWRRQVRQGSLVAGSVAMFVPLRVSPDGPAVPTVAPTQANPVAAGQIEITLPGGTVIRVGEAISAAALRRVMAALRA